MAQLLICRADRSTGAVPSVKRLREALLHGA